MNLNFTNIDFFNHFLNSYVYVKLDSYFKTEEGFKMNPLWKLISYFLHNNDTNAFLPNKMLAMHFSVLNVERSSEIFPK